MIQEQVADVHLYSISLDDLLKEKETLSMANYLDYLEESTSIVKSKKNLSELILIVSYLVIWAFALIFFWFFTSESDAMGYSIIFLWIVLSVATCTVSLLIGKNDSFGNNKWFSPLVLDLMHILAECGAFSRANTITILEKRIRLLMNQS